MMIENDMPEAHVIDINELVHSMTGERACPLQDHDNIETAIIPIVKRDLRDKDNEIYEPNYLSVGPYHHGSPAIQNMHQVKYAYLDYILKLNPERTLADYLSAIKGIEKQVKCAYANEIKMDRDTFLKVLLLDGCFVLVALNGIELGAVLPKQDCNMLDANKKESNDISQVTEVGDQSKGITPASTEKLCKEEDSKQEYRQYEMVLRDILLLENQIPFCVVEKIFEVLTGTIDSTTLLTNNITQSLLNEISLISYIPTEIRNDVQQQKFYHLLHLCHLFFDPSRKQLNRHQHHTESQFCHQILPLGTHFPKRNERAIIPDVVKSEKLTGSQQVHHQWRQATQYHAAKINLKKRELCSDNGHSLLEIKFSNNTLEIPPLSVDPRTYCLLANLVAFEQACPQFGNYVTSYVVFWSQLVSTADDASMLIKEGIIINHLQSDQEVSKLFGALSDGITFDYNSEYYLNPLCHMVEARYQRQRPGWSELFDMVGSNIQSWVSGNQPELPITQSVEGSL